MGIDPKKYTREKLDALALETGVSEEDIANAETKDDVVALIEGRGGDLPNGSNDSDAPKVSEKRVDRITFIVNGIRVDANGKRVEG